jgi:carbonic anhydrase/acetyltransferase-like protein (isoleucine patch superfamily)
MTIYALGGVTPRLHESCWVASSADVIGDVTLAADCSVWFGAVLRGDNDPMTFGAGTNIQDGAVCHSDSGKPLNVGSNCTIGHRAILHGCTIGDGTLIGMGATVLNGAVIGPGCLVGANALVTENKSFPARSLIVGAPAKAVRTLTDEDVAGLLAAAKHYVDNARKFRAGLKPV